VWELTPSEHISKNELEAAKLVKYTYFNAQEQPQFVWPAAFVVARAYTDQMARNSAVPKAWLDGVLAQLATAEKAKGGARSSVLNALAAQLDKDAAASPESARVQALSGVVKGLAK
jgi:N-glycosylase/DNA lyase